MFSGHWSANQTSVSCGASNASGATPTTRPGPPVANRIVLPTISRVGGEEASPRPARQHHRAHRSRFVVLGRERPAHGHRHAEHLEESFGDADRDDLARVAAVAAQAVVVARHERGTGHQVRRAAQRRQFLGRDEADGESSVGHRRANGVDVAGVRVRQRPQQRGLHDGKQRRRRRNPERERADGRREERRLAQQRAQRDSQLEHGRDSTAGRS